MEARDEKYTFQTIKLYSKDKKIEKTIDVGLRIDDLGQLELPDIIYDGGRNYYLRDANGQYIRATISIVFT